MLYGSRFSGKRTLKREMKAVHILLEQRSGGQTLVSHKKPTFRWEAVLVITIYIFSVLKVMFGRFLWQNASSIKSDLVDFGIMFLIIHATMLSSRGECLPVL